jgi:transposase
LGGVPRLVVPDNTRSGVSRACRYEPDLNRSYHELAMHYGVAVLPARPRKPRDKTWTSYCTSSRFWNSESRLLGSTAALPLDQLRVLERFI